MSLPGFNPNPSSTSANPAPRDLPSNSHDARIESLRKEIQQTIQNSSQINLQIHNIQTDILEKLEHKGTQTEILIKLAFVKKLQILLKLKKLVRQKHLAICKQIYLDSNGIHPALLEHDLGDSLFLKFIKVSMSAIPPHMYPVAYFFDLEAIFESFQKKPLPEEKELSALQTLDEILAQNISKEIKETKTDVLDHLQKVINLLKPIDSLCQTHQFDRQLQHKWQKEILDALIDKTWSHPTMAQSYSLALDARIRLDYALMKMTQDDNRFNITIDIQSIKSVLMHDFPAELALFTEQKSLLASMEDEFISAFNLACQQTSGSTQKAEQTPLQNAINYFKHIQSNPITKFQPLCNKLREDLVSLKKQAHILNDSLLFTYIRNQNIFLDSSEKDLKTWTKHAIRDVEDFHRTKNPDLSEDHLHTVMAIRTLKEGLQKVIDEVKSKKDQAAAAIAVNSATSQANTSPNTTPSSASSSLFSPKPEEVKLHNELLQNFMERLNKFNTRLPFKDLDKSEQDTLKRTQIYACLYEIKQFVEKLDQSHAQFMSGLSLGELSLLLKGIIHAKALLDGVMTKDKIDSKHTEFMKFSKTIALCLVAKDFQALKSTAFYQESISYAQSIEEKPERMLIRDRAHYCCALAIEPLLISCIKAELPEGMKQSAMTMMGIHKDIYKKKTIVSLNK